MNNTAQKNNNKKNNTNPAVAVATGAVIGAGIAAAGAYVLKDEKNRDKVKKAFSNVRDQAMGYVENLEEVAQGKLEEKVPTLKSSATKALSSAKGKLTNKK